VIDFHSHFIPQCYRDELSRLGMEAPDGMRGVPAWSEDLALGLMDRFGVDAALLSISSPGIHFGDQQAANRLAGQVNSAGAELCDRHPNRFGFFATLPLPDIDASVRELRRSTQELGCAGVILLSNYRGIYLGDERLDPIFAELDKLGSLVFIHPTSPAAVSQLGGPWAAPIFEFQLDTTRAVANLLFSRTLERYPRIRYVIAHAGAALPALADRLDAVGNRLVKSDDGPIPVIEQLKRLHYDLAGFPAPNHLPSLLSLVGPEQLLWGLDWPHTLESMIAQGVHAIESSPHMTPKVLDMAKRRNAARLLYGEAE
jgi:predicted TIM-barrel fold metal-dependent hydrolase